MSRSRLLVARLLLRFAPPPQGGAAGPVQGSRRRRGTGRAALGRTQLAKYWGGGRRLDADGS